MANISNPFVTACRYFPSKYTISTLQSVDIADNQYSYGRIWKLSRFSVSDNRVFDAHLQYVRNADPEVRITCAKLRKIRQTHVNNDCLFLLVRLILYHFTCFSIYDLMLLLGRQRQGHPAKSYRRSPFCRLCSCSTPMRSILL